MAETLTRTYHGHEIVSTINETPIEDSDGWTHLVDDGETFLTLGEAIQHAKKHMRITFEGAEIVQVDPKDMFETLIPGTVNEDGDFVTIDQMATDFDPPPAATSNEESE